MTETSDKPRRRFIVGKAFFALLILFILASVAGRLWWAWYADRDNQAVINEIRQRGEPVTWREMQPPAVPDDRNAVEFYNRIFATPEYQKAMDLTVVLRSALPGTAPATSGTRPSGSPAPRPSEKAPPKADDEWVLVDKPDDLPNWTSREDLHEKLSDAEFRHTHPEMAARFFSMVEQPLALARQAHGMKADFKGDYSGTYFSFHEPSLQKYLGLARALRVAACIAHDRGDDVRVVEYLRDGLDIGEAMYGNPTLIGQMVGVSTDSIMAIAIEGIAPTLKVGPAPAASPEQVRALIAQLLATQSAQDNFARAFMAERTTVQDFAKMIVEDPTSMQTLQDSEGPQRKTPAPASWLFRFVSGPMWEIQATEHMRYMNWYVAQAKLGRVGPPTPGPPMVDLEDAGPLKKVSHYLNLMFTPALSRAFTMLYRGFSNRRMAATALAIRLWECEHGKRPATLAELCPQYLPTVPEDPFDPARKGIKYLPAAKHPILYVVGQDLRDNGGQYRLTVNKKGFDPETLDTPFFLNGMEDRQEAIRELSGIAAPRAPVRPGGP
jgi:hypothetical protein